MTSTSSTEASARPKRSRPKMPVVSASIVLAAIAAFGVPWASLGALGNSSCDIYCGSPAVLGRVLILAPLTLVLSGLLGSFSRCLP